MEVSDLCTYIHWKIKNYNLDSKNKRVEYNQYFYKDHNVIGLQFITDLNGNHFLVKSIAKDAKSKYPLLEIGDKLLSINNKI